jgi:DNA-binding transcriptional MerR regulator
MRISELSRQTGVPVPTIKFYLRERLLAPGRATGRNQAQYDDSHRRRLQLIKACTGIGRLDLSSVRTLLSAVDDDRLSMPELLGVVNRVLHRPGRRPGDCPDAIRADADVTALVARLDWRIGPGSPGRTRLLEVLTAMRCLGCDRGEDGFAAFGEAAELLVQRQTDLITAGGAHADRSAAVARAVLLDEALSALRQMAYEHHLSRLCGPPSRMPRTG